MPDDEKKEGPRQAVIKLEWGDSSHLEPIYANQLLVSHVGGSEFQITFGQLLLEPTLGTPPETAEIRPVTRLVVTSERFPVFVAALTKNLERYRDTEAADASEHDRDN